MGAPQPLRGRKPADRRVIVARHPSNGQPLRTSLLSLPGSATSRLVAGLSRIRELRHATPEVTDVAQEAAPADEGKSLRGRKMGDRRLVVARPHARYFRYAGAGVMVAKESASAPMTPVGRLIARAKALLIGRPLATAREIDERLSKKKALAIFSSDAISSSAYAVDEILRALIVAGFAVLAFSVGVASAIAIMLAVVAFSYRQLCHAYPKGGGAYVVAKENLGRTASLVAAAALMIDYVMTVAVSTAAAIANLEVAWRPLGEHRVELSVLAVVLVTTANLRGVRESGNIFALPTYLFIGSALLAIGVGLAHALLGAGVGFVGAAVPVAKPDSAFVEGDQAFVGLAAVALLLKAFAGGSVALTGVEAIADGVAAFKPPEPKNAANTLVAMAVLLGVLFVGLAVVGVVYQVWPTRESGDTVLGQISKAVYGAGTLPFFMLQLSAALILFLAANTSFNAFPRMAAILAQDGFMPRQFAFRGDRLAFSWGIVFLSAAAIGMLFLFRANQHRLIPLYSVGVFVCFTLAQASLVLRWRALRGEGWRRRATINAIGAVLTFTVFLIVAAEKLADGAWMVLVAVPVLFGLMQFVHRQYEQTAQQLEIEPDRAIPDPHRHNVAVIPVPGVNRAVVHAVNVARSITTDVRALYVSESEERSEAIRERWIRQFPKVPLVIVESPYRALVAPVVAYLDVLEKARPQATEAPMMFVVVPEYVAESWWERLLYNQAGKQLRAVLLGRPHTAVISVPYRRSSAVQDVPLAVPTGTLVPKEDHPTTR